MVNCEICGKPLLSGLVNIGIKTCLGCRPQDDARLNTTAFDSKRFQKAYKGIIYTNTREGYYGGVGGYD